MEMEEQRAKLDVRLAAVKDKNLHELAKDAGAMSMAKNLFGANCSTCHGSDARGSKGFPNLTDADWLHGGSPEKIAETITRGRIGAMPPMAVAVGTPKDVNDVANYVLSLSGDAHNPIAAHSGRKKFAACAACQRLRIQ